MRAALLSLVFLGTIALAPVPAYAATATFFGPIVPPECNCEAVPTPEGGTVSSGADWGCALKTIQNATNFAVSITVIILVLAIAYAGFTFIIGSSNPGMRKKARTLVLNILIGLVVVLGAWLLVDFVMKILYGETGRFGPWNEILIQGNAPNCIQVAADPPALPSIIGSLTGGTRTGGRPTSGGSCTVPTNPAHPCSVERLRGTCFERHGAAASAVCNFESNGGQVTAESGSDRLDRGRGPSYSIGLWQINLTTSVLITPQGRLQCHTAFTNRCEGANIRGNGRIGSCNSSVKNTPDARALYQQCVTQAKNLEVSMASACNIYREHGNSLNPWRHTALNVCRVPLR